MSETRHVTGLARDRIGMAQWALLTRSRVPATTWWNEPFAELP
jgi:hypothetical protein